MSKPVWWKRLRCWFNGHTWKTTAMFWGKRIENDIGWMTGGEYTTICEACGVERWSSRLVDGNE